jgi:hypothetical protein
MDTKLQNKYLRKLGAAQKDDDTESAHCDADGLLCDLLIELGYDKVVAAYQEIEKWYA